MNIAQLHEIGLMSSWLTQSVALRHFPVSGAFLMQGECGIDKFRQVAAMSQAGEGGLFAYTDQALGCAARRHPLNLAEESPQLAALAPILTKQWSIVRPEDLELLVSRKIPFGKHKGAVIADLPGNYLNWFAREGFPQGEIGRLLALMHEMDHNGLRPLLNPLRKESS